MSHVRVNGEWVDCRHADIVAMDALVDAGKHSTREAAAVSVLGLKSPVKKKKGAK